jgi:hypothetical protein
MAGQGKKTFIAGEVLTAQDVNDFLADQVVFNFASDAARSSAIPTPTEGMLALSKDTQQINYYNGSDFVSALPIGAWTSYTPVWSGNLTAPTIGNGTATGLFCQIGKTVHFVLSITLGSTSTVGTSSRYSFSIPTSNKNISAHVISGLYTDNSASQIYPLTCRIDETAVNVAFYTAGPTSITGNVLAAAKPVVPATGDIYVMSGTYEAV